jgi:hypothetical protein
MPPLPRLRTPALAHIAEQLRFAPKPAARRHVGNLERLALTLAPPTAYPAEWLLFQITGTRVAIAGDPIIPATDLLDDLPALLHRLCLRAAFSRDELLAEGWLEQPAACARLNVTPRSLQRFQHLGLLSRRALAPVRGSWVPMFLPSALDRFLAAHVSTKPAAITRPNTGTQRAARTKRIPPIEAERIVRISARAAARFGWSLATCARKLAPRIHRSPEGIRQVLLRAVKRRELAPPATTLSARQRRVILRADRLGIDHAALAKRFRKSQSAIERALLIARAARLRSISFQNILAPQFFPALTSRSHESLLDHPSVRSGLGAGCTADVLEHCRDARDAGWPDLSIELARAKAYAYLIARAASAIQTLPPVPPSLSIDAIETDLRWAARLKVELIRSQQMIMLRSIDVQLERTPESLPPALAADLIARSIHAIAQGVDRFDPFKGGRLASPAGLELNRTVARWLASNAAALAPAPDSPRRATRAVSTPQPLPDWTLTACAWQPFLEPPARIRRALLDPRFGAPAPLLLAAHQHLALQGESPRTIRQIARNLKLPPNLATRRIRETLRLAARWQH